MLQKSNIKCPSFHRTRCLACASMTLCYVASGRIQAYNVDDLKHWDIAGGAVILKEAGGIIRHTKGGPFNIMKPDLICACTEELLNEIQTLIDEADQITDFEFK